ncbi:MAG: ABC transporter substrate-binding protein [Anaerolineae bacterium]
MKRVQLIVIALALLASAALAGGVKAQTPSLRVMLDWTPNTNHLGLYVAQAKGFYEEAGVSVELLPPGDTLVEQIVSAGTADVGVSYSEGFTIARASGLPIVSIAAIIQHNTSGFAALSDAHPLKSPADLKGLRYGAFGSPVEQPFIDLLMKCADADASSVEVINVGYVDPLPLLERDKVDFVWLYYAWDGLRAKLSGLNLDMLMLKDYANCVPDYYTPILISSEDVIQNNPDALKAFMAATAKGYQYAIENPEEAADILLQAAPDLDAALVKESALWLKDQFQADAPRWGEQSAEVWQKFVDFMAENKVIEQPFEVDQAFSNDFLPAAETK